MANGDFLLINIALQISLLNITEPLFFSVHIMY